MSDRRRARKRARYWLDLALEDLYEAASLTVRGEPGPDVREAWQRFLWHRQRWEAVQ